MNQEQFNQLVEKRKKLLSEVLQVKAMGYVRDKSDVLHFMNKI